MSGSELFVPSFAAFLSYFVGFCVRYFVLAGACWWLFQVAFRRRWLPYRIQSMFPAAGSIGFEIRWSMVNTLCSGMSTVFTYHLIHTGRARMYFDAAEYGWAYFGLSVPLFVLGYDTWTYWQHRLLHTPWLFRHVHSLHHRITNPTAFAGFAHHPVETFMGNAFFVLFVAFVPIHPVAFGLAGMYLFLGAFVGHLGYELYPRGFTRHPVGGWFVTSTHHNMHHTLVGCNYSDWFTFWDYAMGSIHPTYHDTFEAVKLRVAAARARPQGLPGSRQRAVA